MFTMNNKKQPPELFYKKAVLKNFSKYLQENICARVPSFRALGLQLY